VKKAAYLILLSLFGIKAIGQVGGNATYTFLKLTNSARVAALGGDNISVNDNDLNLVFHNPALLDSAMDKNLVLNYVNYFAGINYGYAAYARKFYKLGNFAAGVHYINYGSFIKADETGKIEGDFKASELALNIFWSKPVLDSLLMIGVNLKPIYSHLETYSSFGLAFDAGANYQSKNKLFSASFVIKNVGSQIKPYVIGNYEPLPLDIQLGFTQKLEHAPLRISGTVHHLQKWDLTYDGNSNQAFTYVKNNQFSQENYTFNIIDNIFRHTIFSMEFVPSKNFNVILAYNHQRRKEMMIDTRPYLVGFSWGSYIKVYKFRISYGQAIYHLAGASSHFSLNLNLNDFYSKSPNK
jgi:hypothetical protein